MDTTNAVSLAPVIIERFLAVDLVAALDRALPFASDDGTRPHLSAVLVTCEGAKVRCVATNGHVLGMFEATVGRLDSTRAFEVLVPREHATLLARWLKSQLRMMKDDPAPEVALQLTAATIVAETRQRTFSIPRLVDVAFPPYEQVIPKYIGPGHEQGVGPIGVAAKYLALVGNAFKGERGGGVKVYRAKELDPLVFVGELLEPTLTATMVVMPMRI